MSAKRLNELSRAEWLKYSISVWGDIKQSDEDRIHKEKHPAVFPIEIPYRLIRTFTFPNDTVLDPFVGTGTTLIACKRLGRNGIGIDISPKFTEISRARLGQISMAPTATRQVVFCDDARNLLKYVDREEAVDFVVTSPPYWRILKEEKTFLKKEATPYTGSEKDLGNIRDYKGFLTAMKEIFSEVHKALKPDKFAVVDVMDVRIGDKFYPMHADLINEMKEIGFEIWDMIIWDRHMEYNQLSAMRYPYAFYVNKVHEYIMIFHKTERIEKKIETIRVEQPAKPKILVQKSLAQPRPYSRTECLGCQFKASMYCRSQCPYNVWKRELY
jgi:DNA modification methylase